MALMSWGLGAFSGIGCREFTLAHSDELGFGICFGTPRLELQCSNYYLPPARLAGAGIGTIVLGIAFGELGAWGLFPVLPPPLWLKGGWWDVLKRHEDL